MVHKVNVGNADNLLIVHMGTDGGGQWMWALGPGQLEECGW